MEQVPLRSDQHGPDNLSAATREHIISQVQRELDAEVATQNRASTGDDPNMREINSMATVLRDAIAALKQQTLDATASFQAEVNNSKANLSKVTSMTGELKAANQEVEQMLGQSGSNFTPSSESTSTPADINGVTVNKMP
jgi:hypothetical protein